MWGFWHCSAVQTSWPRCRVELLDVLSTQHTHLHHLALERHQRERVLAGNDHPLVVERQRLCPRSRLALDHAANLGGGGVECHAGDSLDCVRPR